jgi:hypothetical protein
MNNLIIAMKHFLMHENQIRVLQHINIINNPLRFFPKQRIPSVLVRSTPGPILPPTPSHRLSPLLPSRSLAPQLCGPPAPLIVSRGD